DWPATSPIALRQWERFRFVRVCSGPLTDKDAISIHRALTEPLPARNLRFVLTEIMSSSQDISNYYWTENRAPSGSSAEGIRQSCLAKWRKQVKQSLL